MGQVFGSLTNSGVLNPASNQLQFGNPMEIPGMLSRAAASQAQPASASLDDSGTSFNQPAVQNPQMVKPSFLQAMQMGSTTPGGANAMSPALSKGGKLLAFLKSGVEGALAGHAADEQAVIQSGGRRSGGAGMSFLAGLQFPQQQAQEAAQTQLAIGGAQPVQTPYGNMPAALASKIISPYLRYQGETQAAQTRANATENAATTRANATTQAAQIQKRYLTVPNVGVFDTQQLDGQGRPSLIPGSGQGVEITPELAQDYGIPRDYIGKFMTLPNLMSAERNQIALAPTVKTSTDPLGLTTTSTTQKQLPGRNAVPGVDYQTRPRPRASGGNAPAGGGNGGGGGSLLDRTAQQLVEGDLDPSQLAKRGASYQVILDRANQYSQQKLWNPLRRGQGTV